MTTDNTESDGNDEDDESREKYGIKSGKETVDKAREAVDEDDGECDDDE